ncbi:MAG: NAD(P)-binding protein, partial [Gammaproteobacteria bacterium]
MRVCVIGAGPSGLCAAKEIKEANPEAEITILEKTRSLGGVFAASYQGLTMVNNPLLVNFSDFLAEEALPALEMWKAEHYVAYLRRYAEAHAIDRLIEYGVTVKQARWDEGKWRLDVVSAGVEK